MNSRSIISVLFSILFAGSAFAASTSIEGTAKDAAGKPLNGADVKIESKNQSLTKTVKSDAKGHYAYSGLDSAVTYRVTLLVGGEVKASINNVRAKLGEATQLNFDLKKESASKNGKKATHMVYMPSQTGSNLGGRWVEVDDNGNADTASNLNLQTGGRGVVKGVQSNSPTSRPGGGN